MRKTILLCIIILQTTFFANSKGYWHNVLSKDIKYSVAYNVVGDSSSIYLAGIADGWPTVYVNKSTNLGKTWNVVYKEEGPKYPPYSYFRGLVYPAPGYMYLLFSEGRDISANKKAGTGIKRLDERTGKIVDSVIIEDKYGQANLTSFCMFDSLNGLLYNNALLSITHDGWKSFVLHDIRNGYYNEDSSEYISYYQHYIYDIQPLAMNTFMFRGCTLTDVLQDDYVWDDFCKMTLHDGDSTFTYENITNGIRIKINDDSVHTLTQNSIIYYKRPTDFAYINDSTWVYTAPGKKTGYGQCYTLEIFKTTNRGKYFFQVCNMDLQAYGLHRIKFKDEKNGLATGNSAVLRTTDGGDTWFADTALYNKDWTKFPESAGPWNVHISYADGMEFLGCFSVGVFKYETEFGAGAIDEKQKSHLVYPNPAHSGDMVTIDYPEYINGEILIHDIYGKHIDKVNFIGNSFRLKEGIPKGTYFIVISSNGEVLGREKFIVTE